GRGWATCPSGASTSPALDAAARNSTACSGVAAFLGPAGFSSANPGAASAMARHTAPMQRRACDRVCMLPSAGTGYWARSTLLQSPAGQCDRALPGVQHQFAVDDHMLHAHGELATGFVGRAVLDPLWIEDDDVGEGLLAQGAAVAQAVAAGALAGAGAPRCPPLSRAGAALCAARRPDQPPRPR